MAFIKARKVGVKFENDMNWIKLVYSLRGRYFQKMKKLWENVVL